MIDKRQRGVALMTVIIILMLATLLVASSLKSASWTATMAASEQSATRAFFAAESALHLARRTPPWPTTAPRLSHSTHDGIAVRTDLHYLGESASIPHPDYDAAAHAHLRCHWFLLDVRATGHRYTQSRQQATDCIVALAASATPAAIGFVPGRSLDVGVRLPVSWREVP